MENLSILIAESRETLRFYAGQAISDRTAHAYDGVYRRYLAHGRVGHAGGALTTLRWRRAALRHGAVRQLRRTLPGLEAAIAAGNAAAAASAAEPVRQALAVLHTFPMALPGRPARGTPAAVALAALA